MIFADPHSREEWLKCRCGGIGGSDAGCVVGQNKYRTNQELWRQKVGIEVAKDISDKPSVAYGKKAEEHIRALFALDYPQYCIDYHEYRMYCNDKHHFIYATLDGEIYESNVMRGILEIKTTTIQNHVQWNEWDGGIPNSYYVQVLHQLIATDLKFAILRAYIRYYKNSELNATVRDYRIDRSDVEDDINWLINKEVEFWKHVQSKTEPPLIMPEI